MKRIIIMMLTALLGVSVVQCQQKHKQVNEPVAANKKITTPLTTPAQQAQAIADATKDLCQPDNMTDPTTSQVCDAVGTMTDTSAVQSAIETTDFNTALTDGTTLVTSAIGTDTTSNTTTDSNSVSSTSTSTEPMVNPTPTNNSSLTGTQIGGIALMLAGAAVTVGGISAWRTAYVNGQARNFIKKFNDSSTDFPKDKYIVDMKNKEKLVEDLQDIKFINDFKLHLAVSNLDIVNQMKLIRTLSGRVLASTATTDNKTSALEQLEKIRADLVGLRQARIANEIDNLLALKNAPFLDSDIKTNLIEYKNLVTDYADKLQTQIRIGINEKIFTDPGYPSLKTLSLKDPSHIKVAVETFGNAGTHDKLGKNLAGKGTAIVGAVVGLLGGALMTGLGGGTALAEGTNNPPLVTYINTLGEITPAIKSNSK